MAPNRGVVPMEQSREAMVVQQAEREILGGTPPISAEYKAEVVAAYISSGRTIAEFACSRNLSESTLREWVWNTPLDEPEPATDAAAEAEASARAEAAAAREETRTAYAAAIEAIVRAQVDAAEAIARAEAAARDEIAGVYAEAVEAMLQAEAAAAEKVARVEAAAAEAVAEAKAMAESEATSRRAAEAAAREEVTAAYAAAMEAVVRAVPTAATSQPEASLAVEAPEVAPAPRPFQLSSRAADRTETEAAARAEIAQLVSRLAPVELWVHTTGRTLDEARDAALEQLGVDGAQAEIEVLSNRSRWLPGRIHIRARVRVAEGGRS